MRHSPCIADARLAGAVKHEGIFMARTGKPAGPLHFLAAEEKRPR